MKTALVLGGGGFIGNHLVTRLKSEGYFVRAVDLKYPEFDKSDADEFIIGDLRKPDFVNSIIVDKFREPFYHSQPFDEVYQLAADMGGAGYIFTGEHDADVMHNSATINLNVAEALKDYKETKVFYSSSACMYPQELQNEVAESKTVNKFLCSLSESDAYPANPDSEYGWEKLFSERLFLAYQRNYGLNVSIARFHNIYGPGSVFKGGKEKAPAAICRKVLESYDAVEVWGDGEQTRSFLYISDCVDAVRLLMQSDFAGPINIGSEEMVSINGLVNMVTFIAGKDHIRITHVPGPQGVRGRNSDNSLIEEKLNWKPKYTLMEGIAKTYHWIEQQYL
jgi:GDP-D-mannose 3', 5'-epimerase